MGFALLRALFAFWRYAFVPLSYLLDNHLVADNKESDVVVCLSLELIAFSVSFNDAAPVHLSH